ncbi:hypothetical protein O3P69_008329 [Scylla paramamosain]|uniref:Uncharacterized protein n=1 Tax=Scylla paramamosain TaxID=85552 RepID=A0AAW0SJ28_SCYPA
MLVTHDYPTPDTTVTKPTFCPRSRCSLALGTLASPVRRVCMMVTVLICSGKVTHTYCKFVPSSWITCQPLKEFVKEHELLTKLSGDSNWNAGSLAAAAGPPTHVKSKAATEQCHTAGTGGGPPDETTCTAVELGMLQMLSLTAFAGLPYPESDGATLRGHSDLEVLSQALETQQQIRLSMDELVTVLYKTCPRHFNNLKCRGTFCIHCSSWT